MVTNNRITIKMECLVFTELPTHFFTARLNVTNSSAYDGFQKFFAVLFPLFTRPWIELLKWSLYWLYFCAALLWLITACLVIGSYLNLWLMRITCHSRTAWKYPPSSLLPEMLSILDTRPLTGWLIRKAVLRTRYEVNDLTCMWYQMIGHLAQVNWGKNATNTSNHTSLRIYNLNFSLSNPNLDSTFIMFILVLHSGLA